jgi:hypothetical protein
VFLNNFVEQSKMQFANDMKRLNGIKMDKYFIDTASSIREKLNSHISDISYFQTEVYIRMNIHIFIKSNHSFIYILMYAYMYIYTYLSILCEH